jgi:hypothetical protein
MNFAQSVQKLAKLTELEKVTPQEYAENLFYSVAVLDTVNIEDLRIVLTSVPLNAQSALLKHIAAILADDFRYPELHYGVVGPTTEERERIRLQYQHRVKDFAKWLDAEFKISFRPEQDAIP